MPKVTVDWYRQHRVMHWDMPQKDEQSEQSLDTDDSEKCQNDSSILRWRTGHASGVQGILRAANRWLKEFRD